MDQPPRSTPLWCLTGTAMWRTEQRAVNGRQHEQRTSERTNERVGGHGGGGQESEGRGVGSGRWVGGGAETEERRRVGRLVGRLEVAEERWHEANAATADATTAPRRSCGCGPVREVNGESCAGCWRPSGAAGAAGLASDNNDLQRKAARAAVRGPQSFEEEIPAPQHKKRQSFINPPSIPLLPLSLPLLPFVAC